VAPPAAREALAAVEVNELASVTPPVVNAARESLVIGTV